MATNPNVYIDPTTNESKFDIIRDATGNIEDKSWLNRYCKDTKTEVPDILSFADNGRILFITVRLQKTGKSSSMAVEKKDQ